MGDGPGVSRIEGLPSWDLKENEEGVEGIDASSPAGGPLRLSGDSPDPPSALPVPGAEAAHLPSPLPAPEEPPVLCRHLNPAEQPLPALPRRPAPGRLPAGPLPGSL